MRQWEYLVLEVEDAGDRMRPHEINGQEIPNWRKTRTFDILNQLGNDGWELVTVRAEGSIETMYFKRGK